MNGYEWWAHRRTATIFAVWIEEGRILGVCGPLDRDQLDDRELSGFSYDPRSEAAERARSHPEQFVLAEPFLRGHIVPVRPRPAAGKLAELDSAAELASSREAQRAA